MAEQLKPHVALPHAELTLLGGSQVAYAEEGIAQTRRSSRMAAECPALRLAA